MDRRAGLHSQNIPHFSQENCHVTELCHVFSNNSERVFSVSNYWQTPGPRDGWSLRFKLYKNNSINCCLAWAFNSSAPIFTLVLARLLIFPCLTRIQETRTLYVVAQNPQRVTNHFICQHRPLGDGLSAETTNGYSYITSIEDAENAGSGVSTPEQYQNFNTQSLQEGVNPFSNYPPTPEASPVTQEYFFRVAVHPVLGMTIVVLVSESSSTSLPLLTCLQGRDNTILWVYGPPLGFDFPDDTQFWLMQNSRVLLPRLRYQSGAPRRDWVQRPSVLFFVQGRLGIKLPLALEGKTEIVGMNIPRGFPLAGCSAITIRINVSSLGWRVTCDSLLASLFQFPGYCSSTEVDKKLTDQCEIDGRKRARSMRVGR